MKPPSRQGSPDDFQTPPSALKPLLPYLKPEWVIWECAAGKGNLVRGLMDAGHEVFATDILTGQDFLTMGVPLGVDCIITNPPYKYKQQFLERAYATGRPFALLLPLTTFETAKRQELFRRHGLEVIFFDKRINFTTPSGKGSGSWFATAWFTWKLHLPQTLNFVHLED